MKYSKLIKKHRKQLIKEVKNTEPYTYEFLTDIVVLKLKQMLEYFEIMGSETKVFDKKKKEWVSSSEQTAKEIKNALSYIERMEETETIEEDEALRRNFYRYIGINIVKWWD